MRKIKGKQNKLELILVQYMPDPGWIPLIDQENYIIIEAWRFRGTISIRIIKAYQLKEGGDHKQRPHAGNSLRKTQMANENLQIWNLLLLKDM